MFDIKPNMCHIFSDVDGTLLMSAAPPQANLDAITRFMKAGGQFSLATGRSIALAENIAALTNANAPSILLDGAITYNFARKELVDYIPLPSGLVEFMEEIVAQFPDIGATVSTLYDAYEVGAVRAYTPPHHHDYRGKIAAISEEWLKLVLIAPVEQFGALLDWLRAFDTMGLSITASGDMFVSITAAGCSKGAAIRRLCDTGRVDPACVVAIGDYENDLDMLDAAAFSACPDNAIEAVKAHADKVYGPAANGAVAQLIDDIMA